MTHRRRGVGVGRHSTYTSSGTSKAAQKKADELKATSLQSAIDTVEKLEVKLTEFAKRHRSEIQKDPVFRHRFLQMCAPLGVDPLSSEKTALGSLLGIGDFYHELSVKIAEVCLSTKSSNGGIMSVREIQTMLKQRKTRLGMAAQQTTTDVSVADIEVAIKKLGKLGGGFRTIQVGKSTMVVSVPTELDNDHMQVLTAAQQVGGEGVTIDQVMKATGWNKQRAERAIELLLQEGMAWLDEYKGVSYYWFTSLWQEGHGDSIPD
jgi:ESCRT-II complex subunit VPS22